MRTLRHITFMERKHRYLTVDVVENRLVRMLLLSLGCFSVGMGVLGIVFPILPTTPWLLLAAYCFARSSERMHTWLLENRLFGRHLRNYLEGRGVPLGVKIYSMTALWLTIGVAIYFFVPILWVDILLLTIGVLVSVHILTLRTINKEPEPCEVR